MNSAAFINKIKRLVIIAMASDDELIETLVLKGGNAIDLVHSVKDSALSRISYDMEFSMEGDFDNNLEDIKNRIHKTLEITFLEHELIVLDYKFAEQPAVVKPKLADMWGGYYITFKLLDATTYEKLNRDPEISRRNAIPLGANNSTKMEIEISKYEYTEGRQIAELEDHKFYVYSPATG